jgi:hypothetical protein
MSLVKIRGYQLLVEFFSKSAQGCFGILRRAQLYFQRVDLSELFRTCGLSCVDDPFLELRVIVHGVWIWWAGDGERRSKVPVLEGLNTL